MTKLTQKQYKVLLTGFEPFGTPRPPTNPSWETVKTLNETTLENENSETFLIHAREIPVEYEPICKLIPTLHDENYDFVIHVGQGHPDRVALETKAANFGYNKLDNVSYCPSDGLAPSKYCKLKSDGNYELTTKLDVNGVVEALKQKEAYKELNVVSSIDAGRYLCEFTYFCSMAETECRERDTVCLFLHVPTPQVDETYLKLKQLVKELVTLLPKFSR